MTISFYKYVRNKMPKPTFLFFNKKKKKEENHAF